MTNHLHITLRTQSPGGGSRGRGVTHLQTAQTISLYATEVTPKTAFSACLTFFIDRYKYNQHSLNAVSRLSQLFESAPNLEY